VGKLLSNDLNEPSMCGITGAVWTAEEAAIDEASLRRMTELLAHRGPDDAGLHCAELKPQPPYPTIPGVALGHRRLAIIDPRENRQPVSNEDGTIWAVFNGEIYNYRALRHRLEGSGHKLRHGGDSETLVHLYEDEGDEFLKHLDGMFAIALWDANRRRLILARDRLGQKPLYYRQERDRLIFASELKSIVAAPGVPREVDPNAIDEYLTYQYVPYPNTIFQGTRKLPPAHYAVFEDRQLMVLSYWQPDFDHQFDCPAADFVTELRQRLSDAVRMRLRSDVPLGAFLSGGVDSSIIVALAQQEVNRPIKTFSIGFAEPEYDESAYARRVAEHLQTEHHEFQVEADAVALLPKLAWHYDEPLGDSSAIPTYLLSQQTRAHVTVALSGDGGDELFGGYERYRAVQLASRFDRLPEGMRRLLAARLWQRIPSSSRQKSILRRGKRFLAALAEEPRRRYANWLTIFGEASRAELYADGFLERLSDSDPLDFLRSACDRSRQRDVTASMMIADLLTYLPCDLMSKVDIASMAVGLECRQPFLDHRVVELAAGMPLRLKLRWGKSKRILRQAFGHLLPPDVFRRRKMGFGVPLDHWFRSALREFASEVLLDAQTLARGYFRREKVEQLIRDHTTGRFDHSARLWALLVLEFWHRAWVDSTRE